MENNTQYEVYDIVIMKKAHPCGCDQWKIIRVGMDYKLKCLNCDRLIMIPYRKFIKSVKRRVTRD